MKNMEEQIKHLVELQKLDKQIYDLKRHLEAIPRQIKALDDELAARQSIVKEAEEKLKRFQLEHKTKEGELATKEEAIKKYQIQLYQVKTNKEYSALEAEIGGLKADGSLIEDAIINLLDEIEAAKSLTEKNKGILAGEQKKNSDEKRKLEEESKRLSETLANIEKERGEYVTKIDKQIYAQYDRVLLNKSGLAMVPIIGHSCGGCNMNLPPQVINEIKMKKYLVTCGSCSRILYEEDGA